MHTISREVPILSTATNQLRGANPKNSNTICVDNHNLVHVSIKGNSFGMSMNQTLNHDQLHYPVSVHTLTLAVIAGHPSR